MKKHIILAVVVVAALVVAGTSGVFATWSDSETSMDNIITTGAVDLKVNGQDDANDYGAVGVPSKVDIECMIPNKWYGGYEVELWHGGQCTENSSAYIHFKDMCCSNIPPKVNPYPDGGSFWWAEYHGLDATTGYVCPETGDLKPEPELVAEFGGKVDCREVPGIGTLGDTCSMKSSIEIVVLDESGNRIIGPCRIGDLEGEEMFLFELEPCHARTIYLWFLLHQWSEEEFGYNIFPNPDEGGDEFEWAKFNDWPSNALMKDKLSFSMEFDLILWDDPPVTPGT